jgi:hypothetical protein
MRGGGGEMGELPPSLSTATARPGEDSRGRVGWAGKKMGIGGGGRGREGSIYTYIYIYIYIYI